MMMGSSEIQRPSKPNAWFKLARLGKERTVKHGWHPGGVVPYGYKKVYDPDQKRLVMQADPQEAPVVRHIFKGYLITESLGDLSQKLNKEKITNRRGATWSRPALAFMLSNKVYIGQVKYGGVKTTGKHPPIITPTVFDKIQHLKTENRRRW